MRLRKPTSRSSYPASSEVQTPATPGAPPTWSGAWPRTAAASTWPTCPIVVTTSAYCGPWGGRPATFTWARPAPRSWSCPTSSRAPRDGWIAPPGGWRGRPCGTGGSGGRRTCADPSLAGVLAACQPRIRNPRPLRTSATRRPHRPGRHRRLARPAPPPAWADRAAGARRATR